MSQNPDPNSSPSSPPNAFAGAPSSRDSTVSQRSAVPKRAEASQQRAESPSIAPLSGSAFAAAGRRLLAVLVDHALTDAWRTADDFLRHFPVEILMARLKGAPDLRAALLVRATGMDERIVRRKSLALASEDLRLALEEGIIHGDHILELLTAEERVRYLEVERLWGFLAEDAFWKLDEASGETQRRAVRARVVYTLERAVAERVLTWRGLLDALGYDAIAEALSPRQLRVLVRFALGRGRQGLVLSERALLEVLPLETLVAALPLEKIWEDVVVRRIAVPCGFVAAEGETRSRPPSVSSGLPEPPAPGFALSGSRAAQRAVASERPPGPGSGRPPGPGPGRPSSFGELQGPVPSELSVELPPSELPLPSQAPPPPAAPAASLAPEADDSERRRLVAHLSDIERLPAGYGGMATAVLRSVRNMYAMLPGATDDIQRKNLIRQSFADEQQLREGLLGLLEFLDSSVDTGDPMIRGAKVEPLIKILLFEEQRRAEADPSSSGLHRSAPPSGQAPGVRSTPPPRVRSSEP